MSSSRTRLFAALAAVGMLTLGGPTTTFAADSEDGIGAALLLPEDVPDGLEPLGIEDATEFDIDFPSYETNGGLDKANQKWARSNLVGTERVAALIDFRMLFPDEATAGAYLDQAEQVLSEAAATGLTLQADAPSVGDDVRWYAGTLQGDGFEAQVQNVLFREGPVVAKVYLLGFGTTVDDALPLAETAAERTAAWLAARPQLSPRASGGPTAEPSVAPSPKPSFVSAKSGAKREHGSPAFSAAPAGTELRQWAVGATASSEYGASDWSAMQATGAPNVGSYLDDKDAWAPHDSDGSEEWLEVSYAQAVVPTAVGIVETYGNGAVVLIEAYDAANDAWVELWSGADPSPDEVTTFVRPLAAVAFAD